MVKKRTHSGYAILLDQESRKKKTSKARAFYYTELNCLPLEAYYLTMAVFATRRKLAALLSRTLSSPSSSLSRSRLSLPLLNFQYQEPLPAPNPFNVPTRYKASGSGYSPLNDPSPNWSNRPPKETILLDGCDYEHWLIVLEFPNDPKPSEEEMINAYVKTLASVVGRYYFILLIDWFFILFCNQSITIGN